MCASQRGAPTLQSPLSICLTVRFLSQAVHRGRHRPAGPPACGQGALCAVRHAAAAGGEFHPTFHCRSERAKCMHLDKQGGAAAVAVGSRPGRQSLPEKQVVESLRSTSGVAPTSNHPLNVQVSERYTRRLPSMQIWSTRSRHQRCRTCCSSQIPQDYDRRRPTMQTWNTRSWHP